METMTTIIYNMGKDRFGTEKKQKANNTYTINRRQQEIAKIRVELRNLTKLYKQADLVEKDGLRELRDEHRTKLKKTATG